MLFMVEDVEDMMFEDTGKLSKADNV